MPLWNSRFRKPLAESALQFSSSIDIDKRMYNDDIDGSKAHVRMLVKQKMISASDGTSILRGLEQIRGEISSGKLKLHWQDEDIHSVIEERLVAKIGEKGKRLHTGRSRNDQVALDERLYLRREIQGVVAGVKQLQRALLKQAEKHRDTIVPGYTHLQRAQPILFAHHLLAYISMLQRDVDRYHDCLKRVNLSPLGAAAFAGTSLPIDRRYVARILKFDGIIENSIDAVSDRDVLVEFISTCSITMMHISRLAEEIVLWSSFEFGFAHVDDSYSTGSSLMPQKKNPDMAELIRGKTGRVYGNLMGLLTIMKGLPLAYNRDMQEDKVHMFEALDTTKSSVQIMSQMLARMTFTSDRFEEELNGDLSLATDIADYLVRKGVAFRTAHSLVGKIVAHCVQRRCLLHDVSMSDFKGFSQAFEPDIYSFLNPRSSIKRKKSVGGTSPSEVTRQIREWKGRLRS
ncbi:MAG: argininosuccinate lyase [bacterium]